MSALALLNGRFAEYLEQLGIKLLHRNILTLRRQILVPKEWRFYCVSLGNLRSPQQQATTVIVGYKYRSSNCQWCEIA